MVALGSAYYKGLVVIGEVDTDWVFVLESLELRNEVEVLSLLSVENVQTLVQTGSHQN